MTISRRAFACLPLALAIPRAFAQGGWPTKPVKVIVPLAAGSAVDNAARIVLARVSQNLNQQFVVENQAGAAGAIGAAAVAKAAPDGYILGGFNDSIMTMVPHLSKNLTWDIQKDFEPVSLVATVEWGLVVSAESPLRTVRDLVEAAKKEPNKLTYGSGGVGSPQHIAMALFCSQAGVQMRHVPYKGATQAAVGLAGKEVDCCAQGLATVKSLLDAGKLRLIAVTTPQRMPQFAGVPTANESGLPGFEFNSWFAMLAPAGTPRPVVNAMSAEIRKALQDAEVRTRLDAQGLTPRGTTPEELGAATRAQLAKYGDLIRRNDIKAE